LISHVLIPFAGTCISQCQHQQFKTRYRTYGRRGATLTTGTKTKAPVDHATALRIFDKLVSEKQSKGYTEGADGTPYLQSEKAGRVSGLLPQLLNVIDEREAARLMADTRWIMQEKFDCRRLILRKVGVAVEGINKLGLVVSVAAPIAAACSSASVLGK